MDSDERGAMRAEALRRVLARGEPDRPVIVCAQAGNVNGGAVDPLRAIGEAARAAGAWLHVDGAFGLWAAASPRRRALVDGAELAHSWATDAHKWLNVPYDCGVAVVSDREAHRAAVGTSASYLVQGDGTGPRDPTDWTPELSRRARGLALYAALRSLGRSGVAELVDRLCACAERAAERLGEDEALEVLGCELNQVVVALRADDASTDAVVAAVQREGTCWVSPTTWRGRRGIRLSMSNWKTTPADVDRSVAAIRAAAAAMGAGGPEASSRATPR